MKTVQAVLHTETADTTHILYSLSFPLFKSDPGHLRFYIPAYDAVYSHKEFGLNALFEGLAAASQQNLQPPGFEPNLLAHCTATLLTLWEWGFSS